MQLLIAAGRHEEEADFSIEGISPLMTPMCGPSFPRTFSTQSRELPTLPLRWILALSYSNHSLSPVSRHMSRVSLDFRCMCVPTSHYQPPKRPAPVTLWRQQRVGYIACPHFFTKSVIVLDNQAESEDAPMTFNPSYKQILALTLSLRVLCRVSCKWRQGNLLQPCTIVRGPNWAKSSSKALEDLRSYLKLSSQHMKHVIGDPVIANRQNCWPDPSLKPTCQWRDANE